jgi:PKD repeat protein
MPRLLSRSHPILRAGMLVLFVLIATLASRSGLAQSVCDPNPCGSGQTCTMECSLGPNGETICDPICSAPVCNNNGQCESTLGETSSNCNDCGGPSCVPVGCGDRCGQQDDGCGNLINCGSCGYCGDDICNEPEAQCPRDCLAHWCNNDGVCDSGETAADCPNDNCDSLCNNNGVCEGNEDWKHCPQDNCAKPCVPNIPAFTFSPSTPTAGQPITFSAISSFILDPPTPLWDMGNGVHLSGNPLTYTYPTPGTYNVVLTATESACSKTELSSPVAVQVSSPPPACPLHPDFPAECCGNGQCDLSDATFCPAECTSTSSFILDSGGPYGGSVGEAVDFAAFASAPENEPVVAYSWDFGDGSQGSGRTPSHTYAAAGTHVVRVTASTSLRQTDATTTATITEGPTSSAFPSCNLCHHEQSLAWDLTNGRLDAFVTFWQDQIPSEIEYRFNEPVALAKIYNPDGKEVYSSGYVRVSDPFISGVSGDRVTIDFREFYARNQGRYTPGKWQMRVWYYYTRRELPFAPSLVDQDYDTFGTVPSCREQDPELCGVLISNPKVPDGQSTQAIVINPDPSVQYLFDNSTWQIAPPNLPGPIGELSNGPPSLGLNGAGQVGTSIPIRPKWITFGGACGGANIFLDDVKRYVLSRYEVWYKVLNTAHPEGRAAVTVTVPWGDDENYSLPPSDAEQTRAAGAVSFPQVEATLAISRTGSRFVVDVESSDFVRTTSEPIYAPLLRSSQFFAKIRAHEEDHVDFFTNPTRCGYKYFTVASARQALTLCAADDGPEGCIRATESDAIQAAAAALVKWQRAEGRVFNSQDYEFAQQEAEAKANAVPPFTLFQTCRSPVVTKSCQR